jgi:SAM-dependent methyltransferase
MLNNHADIQVEGEGMCSSACAVCGAPGMELYVQLRDVTFGVPGSWGLNRCENERCGHIWLHPAPDGSEIVEFYKDYYTHTESARAISRMHRLSAMLVGTERERRDAWALYVNSPRPGRLLEVGFGDGSRLRYFQREGWDVEGQEFDPLAAANARTLGFKVHLGDLADLRLPAESYDAVVGSHVLEHVRDPVRFLAEARRLLKPGGQMVMVTPNGESYGHRRFGAQWRGLEVPRHLHIFSPGSLGIVVQSLNLGSYAIRTTSVNAINFLIPSIKASRGSGRFDRRNAVSVKLATVLHLIRARACFRRDPQSGEELVLQWWA